MGLDRQRLNLGLEVVALICRDGDDRRRPAILASFANIILIYFVEDRHG